MAMSSSAPVECLKPESSMKACWSSKNVSFSRPHSPSLLIRVGRNGWCGCGGQQQQQTLHPCMCRVTRSPRQAGSQHARTRTDRVMWAGRQSSQERKHAGVPRHVSEVLEGGGARGGDVADAGLGQALLDVVDAERRLGGLVDLDDLARHLLLRDQALGLVPLVEDQRAWGACVGVGYVC